MKTPKNIPINQQRVRDAEGQLYESVDAFAKAKLEQASKTLAKLNLNQLAGKPTQS